MWGIWVSYNYPSKLETLGLLVVWLQKVDAVGGILGGYLLL